MTQRAAYRVPFQPAKPLSPKGWGGVQLAALATLLILTSWAGASVEVLSPDEVLETATVRLDGSLHLVVGDGPTVPLITDPSDPEILNRGDGVFYPASMELVEEALAFVEERFVGALDFQIFVLPYPRSGQLRSTAEDGVIYLTPGVHPYTRGQIHFLISHEVGHIVHQQLLPDSDTDRWNTYRELRGISDDSVYNENASHPNRPHEIFAEDFRQLYGGPVGSTFVQENLDLAAAGEARGLRTFFASLLPQLYEFDDSAPLVFGPNPFRPGQRLAFRWPGGGEHRVEILDASGRRLVARTFQVTQGDGFTWLWDGRDDRGRRLASGTYFVRLTGADGGAVGRVILVN